MTKSKTKKEKCPECGKSFIRLSSHMIVHKKKKKIGRKLFDGKDEKGVLAKLEQSAALDATVLEMCFYAEISADAYYRYLKKHEEFRDRIKGLRNNPVLLARKRVVEGIKESYNNAMNYLERKRKSEFSTRSELAVDKPINNSEEIVNEVETWFKTQDNNADKDIKRKTDKEDSK